jgi:hypothetical protein
MYLEFMAIVYSRRVGYGAHFHAIGSPLYVALA